MILGGKSVLHGREVAATRLSVPDYRRQSVTRGAKLSVSARICSPSVTENPRGREALLLQRFKGHTAAVTATLVTSDTEHGKEFISCSLDKSVALWHIQTANEDGEQAVQTDERVRMQPQSAPIFSLAAEPPTVNSIRRQVWCGNAAKSISTWELPAPEFENKVTLNGHTGWVRALATDGRWLFSSGCNRISQWDLSRSVPRKFSELSLYTGDVQGLATGGGRVYSCGADGSIRCWAIGKKGELTPVAAIEKAHSERISAILYRGECLYSVSLDGSIKMWDASSLALIGAVDKAHGGGKIHCAAVGSDGTLYTGGDDKLIRRWQLGSLQPAQESALFCHNYPVRSLAAGQLETLISADSAGEVAVWKV